MPACAPCQAAKRAIACDLFGDDHDGGHVHFHASVAFGGENRFEAERRGFAEGGNCEIEIAVQDCFGVGRYVAVEEFACCSGYGFVFFGEVGWGEDFFRRVLFDQE